LYTKYYFDKQDKEEVEILVENLRSAFLDRIENNPWLSPKAKNLVSEKISALETKIGGYPIDTLSYGDLDLTSDFLLNILESKRYSNTVTQLRNGKTIDDSEWTVYPHSTNAWYGTSRNDLTFPAGNINMLFDRNAEPAENYAKLGATIAHEMTHAVDNTGRLYDKNGDYIKWWQFSQKWKSNDIMQFENRSQKLIKLYSNFTILDTLYLNGKNTLGENIADLGGLNIAFDAFRNTIKDHERVLVNGYTPEQRFFISYAQKWADNLSPTLQTFYVKYYMHSPPKYRTNGVVYNIDKFYEVFNITTGKRTSIKIW
jgi:putative endopeptidase